MEAIGIDIGGVIIDRVKERKDTSFQTDRYLETPEVPLAFEAIALLVKRRFGKNAWVVSKCGKRIEERSRAWLEHNRFFERTGIPGENLRFCRTRAGKAPICEELGITHFVDDRLEVLIAMAEAVPHRFLFRPRPKEVAEFKDRMTTERTVDYWDEIVVELV